ncbi:MAG TPA: hypothetical protein VM121_05000 [Acidimicrobiales bacterium]|nr:hypothetical protein [Acidimicrobiales bacterium]
MGRRVRFWMKADLDTVLAQVNDCMSELNSEERDAQLTFLWLAVAKQDTDRIAGARLADAAVSDLVLEHMRRREDQQRWGSEERRRSEEVRLRYEQHRQEIPSSPAFEREVSVLRDALRRGQWTPPPESGSASAT